MIGNINQENNSLENINSSYFNSTNCINTPLTISNQMENKPISSCDISKRDKELYVLNLPNILNESEVKELLNTALISIEANDTFGEPITEVIKKRGTDYFFLYFRTINECKNAMKLNGMKILNKILYVDKPYRPDDKSSSDEDKKNTPNDLFPLLTTFEKELKYKNIIEKEKRRFKEKTIKKGKGKNKRIKSPKRNKAEETNYCERGNKLLVMNLPSYFNEHDIYKLFKIFGKIKKIQLIKDSKANTSKGQCYLEYKDLISFQNALKYGSNIRIDGDCTFIQPFIPNKDINLKFEYQ